MPADIASDLTVSGIAGLPVGGKASYRMLDGAAVYVLPMPTSIAAAVPCTISFTGFTNTSTAGSYTSIITTYDNSATPVQIDSTTTGALLFDPASGNANASATIDPTFSFAVTNRSSSCNGESNFLTTAGSATAVSFGHLGVNSNASGGQALTVASNSGGGFVVYLRGTQATQNLRSSIYNWTDVAGTYASPSALGSGEAFGYTYKDASSGTTLINSANATFMSLDATNRALMATSNASGNGCVSYDAQTGSATPAANYSATVIYTAVPTF